MDANGLGAFASVQDVTKTYFKGKIRVPVLNHISFEVQPGEVLAIMGTSGSGKTTLLNLLGGIDRPDTGRIQVAGSNLTALGDGALARWRSRNVGFIFQFYNLLPALSAARNVELPLLLSSLNASERRSRVMEALNLVGLSDRAEHRPEELSGGQQQRVAIARALVAEGDLLLCDEPTGDLDRESSIQVMDLFRVLNQEFGKTIVMATHDADVANCAHRTMHLTRAESSS
ncbi:ABC transporter ATP-binding protein [Paracoccus aminophilus]|uniref:ABC transporter, ATP-binding protein n=1 Tax=Paracoccus aminophilus JCM 7686 TaxID=1367847 RepID=S5Y5F2_PARAH|nr:ABC transporter ATP-binding protein [Paracoccus aminophilus]AGT10945.1 ABC transporter, ATP-binding protein [Paracoccus aminophilus JCM 7686]